jgi:hypothetical protein
MRRKPDGGEQAGPRRTNLGVEATGS